MGLECIRSNINIFCYYFCSNYGYYRGDVREVVLMFEVSTKEVELQIPQGIYTMILKQFL